MTDDKITSPIILALDYPDERSVFNLVDQLSPEMCRLKIGKELFTRLGPDIVRKLVDRGFDVFLDLKYHDIPNTVANACRAAADLGVWMLNVHAQGGKRMLAAAKEALSNYSQAPLLIAVTVLTSMNDEDLMGLGIEKSLQEYANHLTTLAQSVGLDGVVCSAHEAQTLHEQFGDEFKLVTPGIRLSSDDSGDQRRIMTPVNAIKAGSDYLVIGRSITQSDSPVGQLLTINSEISSLTLEFFS